MKIIIFTIALTFTIGVTAQTKIALNGGVNFNSISWKDKDAINAQSDSSDYTYSSKKGKQGFNVNLLIDIHTEENWYFETGIGLSKKGGITEEQTTLMPGSVAFKKTQYFSPTYLQIPFYLVYLPENKKKYKLTAAAGLHVGFGVGGKYESNTTVNNGTLRKVSRNAKFDINSTDDFAKMEFSFGARVGFLMNDNIAFNLSFQRSFVNNAPKSLERNGTALHNVIGLTITKFIKR
jgi:hypothetical protein